jgi:L-fuconate dehydratase
VCGHEIRIAVDANQRWDVQAAIEWIHELAPYNLWWVEEATSPDNELGHATIAQAIAPAKLATGGHVHNRIMFKQLLKAGAIDVLQLDATRVGGVNENIAILVLAAKFDVPVSPHAGRSRIVRARAASAMFDFVAVSERLDDRATEYVDHLHQHFVDPVRIRDGRYLAPEQPGFSAAMKAQSLTRYAYPDGPVWANAGKGRPHDVLM